MTRTCCARVLLGCLFGFVATARAAGVDPNFLLDSGPAFQAALDDGRITPIGSYADVSAYYPGRSSDFVVPSLSVQSNTLAADFGAGDTPLGGWNYDYPADPDLNGRNISYTADPGANVKITIILWTDDVFDKSFTFIGPAGGGNLPLNFPANATDPGSIGASSIETTTGFRLSHVVEIRYIIDGHKSVLINDEINVSPEPACVSLIPIVMVIFTGRGRRRRQLGS